MRDSFSLGRVAGIRIGMHWSVLALLALLIWTLTVTFFPATNPDLDGTVHFAMAAVGSLLFFASILLHELGHALQARRDGMNIDGITLWLFGGVARFTGGFPSAGAEFRIAVAGPLVSLALGGAFIGVSFVPGLAEAAVSVAFYLGYVNLLLLVFNLLPALPLDGGRMLRAALWQRRGDFGSATQAAAGVSRVLAYGVIGVGFLLVVLGDTLSGIWLAFIGWFLLQAGGAESRQAVARTRLGEIRVREAMSPDPVAIHPQATLERFVEEAVWGRRHATYPVVDGGRVVGLIATEALARVPREDWSRTRVEDLMIPRAQVATVDPDDDLIAVHDLLMRSEPRRALVLDGERLVGLLALGDVVRTLRLRGLIADAPPARPGSRA